MTSLNVNIKPYSGGSFDPFSRMFLFIGGFLFGGWIIGEGFTEISDLAVRWTACLIGVVFIFVVTVMAFIYTEMDNQHIVNVFRIGGFCRLEYNSVCWDEVRNAESSRSYNKPKTASLKLTTKDGKKFAFTVSRYGEGAERFDEITRYFQKNAVTNHCCPN